MTRPARPYRISRRDRLLVHLACWCRARMSPTTAFYFDLTIYDAMAEVQAQAPDWRGVADRPRAHGAGHARRGEGR
jgi:hypothetical protein